VRTEWSFLVDEDTDPTTATVLRDHGYDAVAVQDTVGKGTADPDLRAYAERTDRILITTDRGFQRAERQRGITVLMVPDDLDGAEVARRTIKTLKYAKIPSDLGDIVWLSEE
jgi:predicted nuclease of predicted toxin-antitoxin system